MAQSPLDALANACDSEEMYPLPCLSASLLTLMLVGLSGCHGDGTGEATVAASTIGISSDTGAGGSVSPRMFGVFHSDGAEAGYVNPGMDVLAFRANMQIEASGALSLEHSVCEEEPTAQRFNWVPVGDDALEVVPSTYAPDGTFQFLADNVASVRMTPGAGCDDVLTVIEYPAGTGKATSTLRWSPGSLCVKPLGELCHHELVWCDGSAPPDCVAE